MKRPSPLLLLLPPVGAFILVLTIYLLTLSPSLTWAHYGADGGDLVTAVARGSIPHPPGFPTYLLLGQAFVRLPWGEPAWRLNLMSALLAAGAAAAAAAAAGRLHRSPEAHPPAGQLAALATGLCLGLAPLLWSQAVIAEVYAPAAFFAALIVLLAVRGGPGWLLGLLWGVGAGVHPVLLFLAPLVIASLWAGPGPRWRRLVPAGLLALLGCGTMYGPVLLAHGGVPSPWGDVRTIGGWWEVVSVRLYRAYLFTLPLAAWPERLLTWASLLARQFTPLGILLAGLGGARLWRERRALAAGGALCFTAWSLYAIGYNTGDSVVYLAPALPLACPFLAAGLLRATTWLRPRVRWAAAAILLLPLLQALLFWGEMDLHGQRQAVEWAQQVLRDAPPQAVLLTAQDAHTFTLWYVRDLLGERPDVVVVDEDLWGQNPYRRWIGGSLGLEQVAPAVSPGEAARQAGRPACRVGRTVLEDP